MPDLVSLDSDSDTDSDNDTSPLPDPVGLGSFNSNVMSLPDLVSVVRPDLVSVDNPGRDMGLPDLMSLSYDRYHPSHYQPASRGMSTLEGYHRNLWNLLKRPSAPEP